MYINQDAFTDDLNIVSGNRITVPISFIRKHDIKVGDKIKVTFEIPHKRTDAIPVV